jgi:hypothetical protein
MLRRKATATERLDVRLDREHRRKLEEVALSRGLTASETVLRIIE